MAENPAEISIRVAAHLNLGDYEWAEAEISIKDRVREGIDKNTAAAVDRIYDLAEAKLAERLEDRLKEDKENGQ